MKSWSGILPTACFLVWALLWGACGRASAAREGFPFEMSPPDMFAGPRAGERAPNFVLKTLGGQSVELAQALGKGPVVLEFGSYTCPIFRQKHEGMEALYGQYGSQASFFTIYTTEAHPKGDPSPYSGREWVTDENERSGILVRQPSSDADRRAVASRARADLGIRTAILVDDMGNSTWKAYGAAPNAAYLIGTDGQVKLRQGWFQKGAFGRALAKELEA